MRGGLIIVKRKKSKKKKNPPAILEHRDQKTIDYINEVLHPLLELATIDDKVDKKIEDEMIDKGMKTVDNFVKFESMARKIGESDSFTYEEVVRFYLIYYLIISETVFAFNCNSLVFTLVNSYIPFYRIRRGKKYEHEITELEDIEHETMNDKLTFLKDNGFGMVVNAYERDFRNAIAHMNFSMNEEWCIEYKSINKMKVVNLEEIISKIHRLFTICQAIAESHALFFRYKDPYSTSF